MAATAETVAAAAVTAAGSGEANRVLPIGTPPPQQQQMPAGISTGFDADLAATCSDAFYSTADGVPSATADADGRDDDQLQVGWQGALGQCKF